MGGPSGKGPPQSVPLSLREDAWSLEEDALLALQESFPGLLDDDARQAPLFRRTLEQLERDNGFGVLLEHAGQSRHR